MGQQVKKMDGASFLPQDELIQRLKEDFPEVFSEGNIDPKKLKAALGEHVDLGERYGLTWKGKNDIFRVIQETTTKTLKPVREESVNFDETENLFIEGDNLEALKILQRSYYGKVKMIYIDPPYNTGNDFVYNDSFAQNKAEYADEAGIRDSKGNLKQLSALQKNSKDSGHYHSNWLNMMYPRLYLARNLLRDDGVIFVSIDENEVHNLRLIMNEIFGEDNFAGEIVWKNSSKNDQAYISIQHEYIMSFVKNKDNNLGDWKEKKEALDEIYKAFGEFRKKYGNDWNKIHSAALEWYNQFSESNPIYSSKHYSWMDENGIYFPADISGPNYGQYRYEVIHPVTGKVCKEPASGWRYPEETMKQRIAKNLIHFGVDETTIPNNKTYLKDTESQSLTSIKYKDGRVASKLLSKLLGGNYFTNPKDIDLLITLIKAVGVTSDDIVLDFFAGSGTTAHAVMQLNAEDGGNRKWIMVQLPEETEENSEAGKAGYKTIADIAKERIKRAGKKIVEENSDKKIDVGFKALKIDETNFKVWDANIKTPQQLEQQMIDSFDTIKHSATEGDLLIELIIKSGLEPTVKKEKQEDSYWRIGDGEILIYLQDNISEETFTAMLGRKPKKVILLERALQDNDELKTNLLLQAEKESIEVLVV